jgi:hypothetical protein
MGGDGKPWGIRIFYGVSGVVSALAIWVTAWRLERGRKAATFQAPDVGAGAFMSIPTRYWTYILLVFGLVLAAAPE